MQGLGAAVIIIQPQRVCAAYVAPSSSGLGRRPLKAEVAGSNPVGATRIPRSELRALAFFLDPAPGVKMGSRFALDAIPLRTMGLTGSAA